MKFFKKVILLLIIPILMPAAVSIKDKTKNMVKHEGFFNIYAHNDSGNIFLEISNFDEEFLMLRGLSRGLGSNDVGFDRGRLHREKIVLFKRIGLKILLVQPNYSYRAISDDINEVNAVAESFAQSTLWGFKVVAENKGSVLIDLTPFLLSDAQSLSQALKDLQQGVFNLDETRSAINLERTKNFPKNSEFDAMLTFTGSNAGDAVKSVVPSAESFTVSQHISFIKLPDNNFQKRVFDPRSGFFGISYYDYATAIAEPLEKRFIARHRLQKKFPDRQKSPAVKPLIYYVDNGAPEPIRSALIEGASWWNQAFEAAGFENAFQVKVLPEGADPMDVRYNVIMWVHRSTRGWSYGNSVTDPRSGEILKGHVSLGSLRVRQDFLIASGLLAPYKDGESTAKESEEMALARLRQLSAHEVGHTLGLNHNFTASYNKRASVMDYPHPLVKIKDDNTFDLSDAYDGKIGEWDKVSIKYGYSTFRDVTAEKAGLEKIINDYIAAGMKYISDNDARPTGGAHPNAHLWDNGRNSAEELEHILKVRQIALNNFSEKVIPIGTPYAELENVLVPIYLMHRYAVEGASKLVGGLDYSYAVRGDKQTITEFIAADLQLKAFKALLKTLSADELTLSEKLLEIFPPPPPGFGRTRESFNSYTGLTFDPLYAAETSINHTLSHIFHPQRIARIIQNNHRNNSNPALEDLWQIYFENIFDDAFSKGLAGDIQRLVQFKTVDHLINLEIDEQSASYVKTWTYNKLLLIKTWTDEKWGIKPVKRREIDHLYYMQNKINRFLDNPDNYKVNPTAKIPPGSPIGIYGADFNCGF